MKVLLPVRVAGCLWITPWFARVVIDGGVGRGWRWVRALVRKGAR